uniref:hypothetical protein n=1 Tax=Pseudomonas laurentiana TaxID=2364649 RepID=UPI0029C844F0|nr:hypothetical protein [Pseudomonas laurentiana]
MNRQSVCVVLDTSGSMMEMGKIETAEYLLGFLFESMALADPAPPFARLRWLDGSRPQIPGEWQASTLAPLFTPEGQGFSCALFESLQQEIDTQGCAAILLLSDGGFASDPWRRWLRDCLVPVHVVMIGADAQEGPLRQLFGKARVFQSEAIDQAWRYWPTQGERVISPPSTFAAALAFVTAPTASAETAVCPDDEWN